MVPLRRCRHGCEQNFSSRLCACLVLGQTSARRSLEKLWPRMHPPQVGGACVSTGLTPKGLRQLKKFDGEKVAGSAPILVVSDFDGIGGVLMSLDLLGVTPDGIICIEKDKVARKVVRERWPGAIHYTDIKEVGPDEVAKWAAWWPEVKLVLHSSGFPSLEVPAAGAEAEGAGNPKQ